ncbi:acyl-CoA thioesterase [Corynebacterium sp. 335C]
MSRTTPFRVTVPVRWTDFDRYGHANNAVFLEYAQEGRRVLVEERLAGQGFPPSVVRHVEIDYLRPVLPDTREVHVDTEITAMGRTSYTLRQTVLDQHENVTAVVTLVMVVVDRDHASPLELTPANRKALAPFASGEAAGE